MNEERKVNGYFVYHYLFLKYMQEIQIYKLPAFSVHTPLRKRVLKHQIFLVSG